MKTRLPGAILMVLYCAVLICIGGLHNHHNHGPLQQQDCAACAYLVNAVTDVSVPVVHVVTEAVTYTPDLPAIVVIVAPVFCTTASRAPPLASA